MLKKLNNVGLEIHKDEVFTSPMAALSILKQKKLNPFCLIHPDIEPEFEEFTKNQEKKNAVLLADMKEHLNFTILNKAFRVLMEDEKNVLVATGGSRFYKDTTGLSLDVGPFAKALKFASGANLIIAGKPSPDFFQASLKQVECSAEEAVMIGDDIVSDVGGAQDVGIRGILVRTGKFTKKDENHPTVKPHAIVNDFLHAIEWIDKFNRTSKL